MKSRGNGGCLSSRTACAAHSEERRRWAVAVVGVSLIAVFGAACAADPMRTQGRLTPLQSTSFFKDRTMARPLPPGAIPQGAGEENEAFMTGKVRGKPVATFPVLVTPALVARGRERFDIYCAVCHGPTGEGNGKVVSFDFTQPPSYYSEDLRALPVGHYFEVITNGFGAMSGYGDRVAPKDRWAIIAYIRSLQAARRSGRPDGQAGVSVPSDGMPK